jgi:hypothetical protein|tara:strand:+ start:16686 stop:16907 length:222 start_codon:yes stop_codon:yes gene_type:complete
MDNNPFQYHHDRNISFAVASLLNMNDKIIKKDKDNKFFALRSVHNLTLKEAKEVYKTYQVVRLVLSESELSEC